VPRRLSALDGLRLLAALAVLGFHYTGIRLPYWGQPAFREFPTLNEVTRYGYLGVELFFIISGFVILMTAYGRTIESFSASRIARLYPAYWVAIILTFALQQFWTAGRNPDLVEAMINLTMVQDALDVPHVQGAFWTLWVELKFYLLIGVFILIGITKQRLIAFAVLWPVIGQVAAATDTGLVATFLFPTYAPYFAAGILLFLLYREGHDVPTWLALGFTWVLCVRQATGYAPRASELVGAPVSPVVTGLAVTAFIVVILIVTHTKAQALDSTWLAAAGALTYPLYLIHGQWGFFVIDTLEEGSHSYLVLAVATISALCIAFLINRLVERPIGPRLRRAVERSLTGAS